MTKYLERIMDAIGRPEPQPAPDWVPVLEYLGLALPTAFVEFTEAYGFAELGPMKLAHPSPTADGFRDLLSQMKEGRRTLEAIRDIRPWKQGPNVPYPIHPEPEGLIRWAASMDRELFCFLARPAGEPDRWPIVWFDIEAVTWTEFEPPFDRFLYDLVTGAVPERLLDGRAFDEYKPLGNGLDGRPVVRSPQPPDNG